MLIYEDIARPPERMVFFMANNSGKVQKAADDKRNRNWTVILYPENLTSDWEIKLQSIGAQIMLSPCHDKDLKEDGTTKKKHYHAILMFSVKKSGSQISGMLKSVFGESNGSIIGVANITAENCIIHNIFAATRYLAHMDNPEKAQYNPGEIRGLNGADVMSKLKITESETQDIILAMQNFVDDNDITEFCDLARAASSDREWYRVLTSKYMFFEKYIRSRKFQQIENRQSAE